MTTTTPPPVRRASIRPRYSLRLLLIAFTAFAIGFPIWYRWPYEEEEQFYRERNGVPDKTQPPIARRVTTWQRQWGSGRLKHGLSTTHLEPGRGREDLTYRDGKTHGPARSYGPDGRMLLLQQYANDELTRETCFGIDGSVQSERALVHGKQHGEAMQCLANGGVIRYRFEHGRLTHIDGQTVESPLLDRLSQGIVDQDTARRLTRGTSPEFGDTLREVLQWYGDENGIPMVIDSCAATSAEKPDFASGAIDLASAIVMTAHAAGCECDYYNGCIWVLPGFGQDWTDPTGVTEIRPAAGSVLATRWNEPVGRISGRELATRISKMAEKLTISIDTTRIEPPEGDPNRYVVDEDIGFMKLRHALTVILFHSRCRCELHGETLVILPQDE